MLRILSRVSLFSPMQATKLEAVVIRISGPAEHTVICFAVFFVGAVQKHALRTKSVGGRQGDLFHSKYPLSMRNFVILLKLEYHFFVVLSRTAYRRRQRREPRLAQTAVRALSEWPAVCRQTLMKAKRTPNKACVYLPAGQGERSVRGVFYRMGILYSESAQVNQIRPSDGQHIILILSIGECGFKTALQKAFCIR